MIWNEKIKELREDHDLTQAQMAEILKTSQRTISYYEKGQREIPIEILIKYSKFFKVSLEEICGLKRN